MEYSVIIHKDEKSGWYTGKCVQVPGAMSQGRTLDELIENMKDAISLMLECYKDEARQGTWHSLSREKLIVFCEMCPREGSLLQIRQQPFTPLQYIPPSGLKVARVPGVGDVAGA